MKTMRMQHVGASILTIASAAAGQALGATYYVDASVSSSGAGTTWSTAKKTIQEALAIPGLTAGDEIRVSQGTYKPSNQTSPIELASAIRIKCGYVGNAGSDPNVRDPSTYLTILSGDLGSGTHAYHVLEASGSSLGPPSGTAYEDKANLDGATITDGAATGTGTNQNIGGGIFIDQGHPTIRNCTITSNTASFGGGGIYCLNTATAPEIRNCKITSNSVTGVFPDMGGGGIGGNYSVKVINALFQTNTAAYEGGGVNIDDADNAVAVTLVNCQFIDNSCTRIGGGVYADAPGTLTMTNCLFNADTADGTGSDGGGIWTASITLDMTNCTVVHCRAEDGVGGGVAAYPSLIDAGAITNCIFFDNYAGDSQDIDDSTDDTLIVSYCAMQELPTQHPEHYNDNIVFGENGAPATPQFVDNSQSDLTLNNYHLACGSVCIDAGTNAALAADSDNADEDSSTSEKTPALEYSLASSDRIIGSTQEVDMGAFERTIQYPCSSPPTGDCAPLPCTDGLVNVDDLLMVVNSWGACPSGQSFCPGDISATYGAVDVDDLLAVINHWSAHCVFETYAAGSLSSVEDCMDAASEEYEANTPDWNDFVNKCVAGLCAAHVIDCDD